MALGETDRSSISSRARAEMDSYSYNIFELCYAWKSPRMKQSAVDFLAHLMRFIVLIDQSGYTTIERHRMDN